MNSKEANKIFNERMKDPKEVKKFIENLAELMKQNEGKNKRDKKVL